MEIKDIADAIEQVGTKANNAITGIKGDMRELREDYAGLAATVTDLAQKQESGTRTTASAKTIGEMFVKQFDESRDLFERTKSVRLEVKAAGDPVTTASGRNLMTGGIGFIAGGVLGFQNALQIIPSTGTSAVEYSRYTGQQGAAAVQAVEGDDKAAMRPDHSLIVQSAITIAGYTKMSRQALADRPAMGRVIDTTLARSVQTKLDAVLVDGNVTPAFTGFSTLATAHTSLIYDTLVDAISEGVAAMQVAGFSPDVVGLNPADWLAVTVAKGETNDHYLSGSYLGAMPTEMRGLRVVLTPSVNVGTALLMDTTHSELIVVDSFHVEVGYSGDDFTKNLVTVLGEMRVIPIFRTLGSARLVTPLAVEESD